MGLGPVLRWVAGPALQSPGPWLGHVCVSPPPPRPPKQVWTQGWEEREQRGTLGRGAKLLGKSTIRRTIRGPLCWELLCCGSRLGCCLRTDGQGHPGRHPPLSSQALEITHLVLDCAPFRVFQNPLAAPQWCRPSLLHLPPRTRGCGCAQWGTLCLTQLGPVATKLPAVSPSGDATPTSHQPQLFCFALQRPWTLCVLSVASVLASKGTAMPAGGAAEGGPRRLGGNLWSCLKIA